MQFYYGQQMPLRILDEAEFWKMQESEHTVVIREVLPNLENEFVMALLQWEQALISTQQKVVRYIESVIRSQCIPADLHRQVIQLVIYCLEESKMFIELIKQIKTHSVATANNPVAQNILNHIIRESEYFIGIAQVILSNKAVY